MRLMFFNGSAMFYNGSAMSVSGNTQYTISLVQGEHRDNKF